MKKYKLSPWHDGSVKPVHKGIYETAIGAFSPGGTSQYWIGMGGTFQYWTGKRWGAWCSDKDEAEACKDEVSWFQSPKWRGILKD